MSKSFEDVDYILYVRENSQVCEDALRIVSEVSSKIQLNFVDIDMVTPSFLNGVPTLVCLPSKQVLVGTQIFNAMFKKLNMI
jgi:hypothetical protein